MRLDGRITRSFRRRSSRLQERAFMIGLPSLLMRTGMVLIFTGLGWWLSRTAWREGRRGQVLLGFLPMGLAAAMVAQLSFNFACLRELRDQDPGMIMEVTVGDTTIRDETALREIAACLATATWFDGRHGEGVAFVISHRDGSRRSWRIVRSGDGAVLDFGPTEGRVARLYRGAAFSECLPEVLRRTGSWMLQDA